ncbi:MAG: hypothetical protein ACYDCO_16910 [Armatimonadota bacterium]
MPLHKLMIIAVGILSLLALAPGCKKKAVGGEGNVPPGTEIDPRLYKGPPPASSKLTGENGPATAQPAPPSADGK